MQVCVIFCYICNVQSFCFYLYNVIKTNIVKGYTFHTFCNLHHILLSSTIQFQEKPFVDMEGINIQIEPKKTYFYDGCVETSENDEIDLLSEEPKINSDEAVSK